MLVFSPTSTIHILHVIDLSVSFLVNRVKTKIIVLIKPNILELKTIETFNLDSTGFFSERKCGLIALKQSRRIAGKTDKVLTVDEKQTVAIQTDRKK